MSRKHLKPSPTWTGSSSHSLEWFYQEHSDGLHLYSEDDSFLQTYRFMIPVKYIRSYLKRLDKKDKTK